MTQPPPPQPPAAASDRRIGATPREGKGPASRGSRVATAGTVTLIAPTWNEIEAVRVVLPRIQREWVDEIIIVDGGSTDGTVEFCRELGLRVYTQKVRGYGAALREAIAESTGDYIIEFQPDGNSVPEMVPKMIAKIEEGYDLVIGSRYQPGAVSYDDDRLTKVGNRSFTFLVNLLFRAKYTDTLIGFRIFRRDAFEKLGIDQDGLAWAIQIPIRFAKGDFRIGEIAADEPARIGGKRKMRPFKHGWEFLMLMLREFFTK
jgi:glycosyltransferase involved in cell wall biosynthesis